MVVRAIGGDEGDLPTLTHFSRGCDKQLSYSIGDHFAAIFWSENDMGVQIVDHMPTSAEFTLSRTHADNIGYGIHSTYGRGNADAGSGHTRMV